MIVRACSVLTGTLFGLTVIGFTSSAHSDPVTATWDGGGDGVQWCDANNWNPDVVPKNDGDDFSVVIPDGNTVTFDITSCDMIMPVQVTDLSFEGTLNVVNSASSLTVNAEAVIGATLDVSAGSFIAMSTNVSFGGSTQLFASNGATVMIGALTYSSTSRLLDTILMSATDSGTLLDLSQLMSLDAGFDSNFSSTQTHTITAVGGATIDLSGVTTITAPVDGEDFLHIIASNNGTIDLSGVTTVGSAGGRTIFETSGTATLDSASLDLASLATATNVDFDLSTTPSISMPSLVTLDKATFTLSSTASISMPNLDSLDDVLFALSGGAQVITAGGSQTATYSSTSRLLDTILMIATDSGTLLDLSQLMSIDAGFDSNFSSTQTHTISASENAEINLSGIGAITGPVDPEDTLAINAISGGTIDFGNVIDTQRTHFWASGSGSLISFASLDLSSNSSLTVTDSATADAGDTQNAGRVALGALGSSSSTGNFTVNGTYSQTPAGTLEIELADNGFGQLNVTDDVILAGTLDLIATLSPNLGDQMLGLITTDSVIEGVFSTVSNVVIDDRLGFAVTYSGTSVDVRVALLGDADVDGDVDGDDFLLWQSNFGALTGATWAMGDTDGDGDVDGDDFLTWQSQFGSVSGSASAAVPEPASIVLLLAMAAVGMFSSRGGINRRLG